MNEENADMELYKDNFINDSIFSHHAYKCISRVVYVHIFYWRRFILGEKMSVDLGKELISTVCSKLHMSIIAYIWP